MFSDMPMCCDCCYTAAIFEAVGADPDAYYTASEAADVAIEYSKQAQLDVTAPDRRTLVLDVLLCDGLYKGLVKKGELYPTHIAKVCGMPGSLWGQLQADRWN